MPECFFLCSRSVSVSLTEEEQCSRLHATLFLEQVVIIKRGAKGVKMCHKLGENRRVVTPRKKLGEGD